MSILSATGLSQSFDFVDVFTGINLTVTFDAKIGLIGPNGVGKTSLLRILAGLEQPTAGNVQLAKGKQIGYLPQEAVDAFADSNNTVFAEMLHVFDALHVMEARMREIEAEMAHGLTDAMADEYGTLQHAFEQGGGYDYETRIKQTLQGLGFGAADWDMPVAHLSGGQKTRALLARLLLQKPDLLILDEPTNHLDFETIEWLEKTMIAWPGSLIICSHDRYFLDKVANRIWEMSKVNIEVYRGNYSAYLQQRDERFERSLFVFSQEKARLEAEMTYIKANFPGDPSVQSRGKLKRLTRDVVTIEKYGTEVLLNEKWMEIAERMSMEGGKPVPFGVEEADKRVSRLRAPSKPPRLTLQLQPSRRSGNIVLKTNRLEVGYRMDDGRPTTDDSQPSVVGRPSSSVSHLFHSEDLELRWQERAALIGPNGSGKTTFLKTALGDLAPLAGEVQLGASLKVGYFAQAHDQLRSSESVLEELLRQSEGHRKLTEGEARHFLATFLFRQDDVFKPVNGLSGGERARLALAILSLQGSNFLVLDEPTNHLDIPAREVLEEALGQFDGTVLLVSHDRYLINKLAQQIWQIEDERLSVFRGTYAEFVTYRQRLASTSRSTSTTETVKAAPKPVAAAPVVTASTSPKKSKNADKQREQRLAELERHIARQEAHLSRINQDMQAAGDKQQLGKVRELSADFAAGQRELDALMREWEALSLEVSA